MKLLVVTPRPLDAETLRTAAGEGVEDAEVLVVSPAAQTSAIKFWMSDADEAIAAAEEAHGETVDSLEEAGIDAVGETGESEPALAIQDALATFRADRVIVFSEAGEGSYREDDGLADAEERFGVPVTFAEL